MGGCLSKKGSSPSSSAKAVVAGAAYPPPDPNCEAIQEEAEHKKMVQAQESIKKEIIVIKQRKSHERRPEERGGGEPGNSVNDECSNANANNGGSSIPPAPVRTSSCTKEEVDAILIQCGRLSRSSSGKVGGSSDNNNNSHGLLNSSSSSGSRKYSGSKRSYDFDHDVSSAADKKGNNDADDEAEEEKQHRRQSRPSHRRSPSRERDAEYKRSGSRDRTSSGEERRRSNGGVRRVSRSPGRRSETPNATIPAAAAAPTPDKSRPGRMVSVPASISTRDKSNGAAAAITESSSMGSKRVSVKRSGEIGSGGLRTAASPRSQSPANTRASNENAQLPPSLSRNSSRKAEHSPYRRNPMNEIDENVLRNQQLSSRAQDLINSSSKATNKKLERNKGGEEGLMMKLTQFQSQKPDERNNGVLVELVHGIGDNNMRGRENNVMSCRAKEQQPIVEQPIDAEELAKTSEVAITKGATGMESQKPQTTMRSRSFRRSRDLDPNLGFNPDTLNPTSYASSLIEDIQNFHLKNTTAFSLPSGLTKACSILETVADLNSENRITEVDPSHDKNVLSNSHLGKRRLEAKDPFLESEVVVRDDLTEPSLHKYVTVRRGMIDGEIEQEESSGSNSFISQHWASSSSWEPNSADSTDRWTSRSNNEEEVVEKEQEPSRLGCQKQAFSESARRAIGHKEIKAQW